jgi:hypothetical protein
MRRKNLDSTSFVPLKHTYCDKDVTLKEKKISTSDGVSFYLEDINKNPTDSKTNYYSSLALVNQKDIYDTVDILTPKSSNREFYPGKVLPDAFATYLQVTDKFLNINKDNTSGYTNNNTWTHATLDSTPGVFDINLIDRDSCTVSYYDNFREWYLTVTTQTTTETSNNYNVRFQRRLGTGFYKFQVFNYLLDRQSNKLMLFKRGFEGKDLLIGNEQVTTASESHLYGTTGDIIWIAEDGGRESMIVGIPITDITNSIFGSEDSHKYAFNITRPPVAKPTIKSSTNWVSYIDSNNSTSYIDNCSIVKDIKTDLLLNTEYYNITGDEIPVNITFLKNHLDLNNNVSRLAPFPGNSNIEYKEYDKIFTSIRQIKGDENISLGYNTYNNSIDFPKGNLTYFHLPQSLYPYKSISIEDSGLKKSGAIGGDTPLYTDKLFKYKEDGDKFSLATYSTSAEKDGTWLCTWLKYMSGGSYKWVDRYYDASKLSVTQALNTVNASTRTDATLNALSSNLANTPIVDKPSSMLLEPGSLYAYYRADSNNINNYINSLSTLRVSQGLNQFKYNTGTDKQPDSTSTYSFSGDSYGITLGDQYNKSKSFTVSFDIHSTDWSDPIGSQLIGNYTHTGFGVYNKKNITPIGLIKYGRVGGGVHICGVNTNFKKLFTIDIPVADIKDTIIAQCDFSSLFYVIYRKTGIYRISSYTYTGKLEKDQGLNIPSMKGTIQKACVYPSADGNSYLLIKDATSSIKTIALPGYNIAKVQPINSTLFSYTLNRDDVEDHSLYIDTTSTVLFLANNVIRTVNHRDESSVGPADLIVDIAFKGDSNDTIIKSFTCDSLDNTWILYCKKNALGTDYDSPIISKYDKDRNHILTTSLSASLNCDGIFKLDTISEFNRGVYNQYPVIIQIDAKNDMVKYVHLSDKGVVTKQGYLDIPADSIDTNISTLFNSNYLNIKYKDETVNNYLYFDVSCNIQDSISPLSIRVPVDQYKYGWHTFSIKFNERINTISLYTNGRPYNHYYLGKTGDSSIISLNLPGKHYISHIINNPLIVGSAGFYGSTPLSQYIKQDNYYASGSIKIKNIYVYNQPLTDSEIISHYRYNTYNEDLYWSIPNDKNHYIDEISRFFKFKLPGRKSEKFDINITTQGSLSTVSTSLVSKLSSEISKFVPHHIDIHSITWNNSLAAGAFDELVPEEDSCFAVAGSTGTTASPGPSIDVWEEILVPASSTLPTTTTTTTVAPIYYEVFEMVTTTSTTPVPLDPWCTTTTAAPPSIDIWEELISVTITTTTTTEAPYTVPSVYNTTTTALPTCPTP